MLRLKVKLGHKSGGAMQTPPRPENEQQRLHSLRALDILDTDAEERFDRLTRLARMVCRTPISVISLVDEYRQWFKSVVGLDVRETPRDVSFCGHAILGHASMRVENVLEDPRFADNPLVVQNPHIRAYAGAPLRLPNGATLGTLCVIDTEARKFSDEELTALEDLARLVENELLAVELAALDELTMLPNRRGLHLLAQYVLSRANRSAESVCALMIDINDFKLINDQFGHAAGDRALQEFSATLRDLFRKTDVIARVGGDEFVVLAQADCALIAEILACFTSRLQEHLGNLGVPFTIHYSVGMAQYDPQRHADFSSLLADADLAMYQSRNIRTTRRVCVGAGHDAQEMAAMAPTA